MKRSAFLFFKALGLLFAILVGIGHGFKERVRFAAGNLLGGGAVKIPIPGVLEFAPEITHHFGFAAQTLSGLIAVEPNVFQLMFAHVYSLYMFY